MSSLFVILIGTVLVNAFLLMQNDEALGGDRHTGSTASAVRIAGATSVTIVLSVCVAYLLWCVLPIAPIDTLLLVYSLGVVGVGVTLQRLTQTRLPRLRRSLASAPILIVSNCLALGAVLLTTRATKSFLTLVFYALCLSAAFALLLPLFVALIARITEAEVPRPFRLAPIALISAGLTALALMGFTGLLQG